MNETQGQDSPADNMAEKETDAGANPAQMADQQDDALQWKDKYMRLSAEFDNYRKRTLKEKMDLVTYGSEDVISSLLPVIDDMDRALNASGQTEDITSVREGVALISQKLRDILKGKGLAEIECMGEPLDTDYHEAVAKIPGDKKSKGRIADVVQKGYKLKDKVIRHSKVVVSE